MLVMQSKFTKTTQKIFQIRGVCPVRRSWIRLGYKPKIVSQYLTISKIPNQAKQLPPIKPKLHLIALNFIFLLSLCGNMHIRFMILIKAGHIIMITEKQKETLNPKYCFLMTFKPIN